MSNFCQCPDVVKKVFEDNMIYLINLNENTYVVKQNTEYVLTECIDHNDIFHDNAHTKGLYFLKVRVAGTRKRKYSELDFVDAEQANTGSSDDYVVFVNKVMKNIRINCQREKIILQRILYNMHNKWNTISLNTICEVIQQFVCKDLKNVMKKRISKSKNALIQEQYITKELIKFLNAN